MKVACFFCCCPLLFLVRLVQDIKDLRGRVETQVVCPQPPLEPSQSNTRAVLGTQVEPAKKAPNATLCTRVVRTHRERKRERLVRVSELLSFERGQREGLTSWPSGRVFPHSEQNLARQPPSLPSPEALFLFLPPNTTKTPPPPETSSSCENNEKKKQSKSAAQITKGK